MKDVVYRDAPQLSNTLRGKSRSVFDFSTLIFLENVFRNAKARINFLVRDQRGHFKHLLKLIKTYVRSLKFFVQVLGKVPWLL